MYSVFSSKAYLVYHHVDENDSPLPPEQCWVLKIRQIDQHCLGGGGGKGQRGA